MQQVGNQQIVTEALRKFGVSGELVFERALTSAVTTSWGVGWDENYIARDLMQNFYDANRDELMKISVQDQANAVMVTAPAQFNLNRLFYLGSEKGDESVGQYGEGFKAASVCLLRDHAVTPLAISGRSVVVLRIGSEKVHGTELSPVVYDFYTLDTEFAGAALILPGCSAKLTAAMKIGLTHFFYEKNALLGALRWGSDNFSVYYSNNSVGHVFYRNLKRGEIEGIPLVLVINKEYQNIERRISKDRDRNAFGEDVMDLFYKAFAGYGIKNLERIQAVVVEAARECWIKGHPLLRAIADTFSYNSYWSLATSNAIFKDCYFSKTGELGDPAKAIAVANMERQWQENGQIGLPGYFQRFSVKNAVRELTRSEEAANKESHKNSQRPPTTLEQNSMKLLMDLMRSIAPDVVSIFAKSSTHYAVITSDKILGELVKGRSYRSKEVYLSENLFVGDFATAMATFLHEHAHIFGQDGSRGFTDALTEMLESVVRHRDQFDSLEAEWGRHSAAIEEERLNAQPSVNDLELWLAGLGDQELRALLAKVPAMTLKRLRNSATAG